MNVVDVSLLFDHLYHLRDRILDSAAKTPSAWVDPEHATVRSLHETLVHELDVEWSWRQLLTSPDPAAFDDSAALTVTELPDVDTIRERWQLDETEMRSWVEDLGDDGLGMPCRAEQPSEHPLWVHLVHIYAHGIQSLSDASVLLTAAGQSPGDLDLLDALDQRAEGSPPER